MTDNQDLAKKAAELMYDKVVEDGLLRQEHAAYYIREAFGDEVTYINKNGNLAIQPKVLEEFKRLTGDDYVWSRSERSWRKREASHADGRSQD